MLVLLRLGCAGLSAFIFVLYMPDPAYLLLRLSRLSGEYDEQSLSSLSNSTATPLILRKHKIYDKSASL